ncbi:MAG: glutamate--tRNA ligase [bacterium]|nr:glutamate--tRNA ligase [bacterium]
MSTDPQKSIETAPRVRIAPSPTGGLHIGTARTALFNWLYAKKHRGVFVLRIEDTDRARSTKEYEQAIIEDLQWLGLSWDEGIEPAGGTHGPYRQTERSEIYATYLKKLLDQDLAYPCFCTKEERETDRQLAIKNKRSPIYAGRCANLNADQRAQKTEQGLTCVYRFRTPDRAIQVVDEIRGKLKFTGSDFGDFVIAKTEHAPLFLLANVVDDSLMNISHVIRGDDHLPNLPKQVLLMQALGFAVPRYAHVPLILNPDRSKMSKRAGPTHVREYRELGFLPEAILNFIALLGWNPATTQEIFTQPQLIEAFNLRQINKSGSIFDLSRLKWMIGMYIRALSEDELVRRSESFWSEAAKKQSTELKRRALVTIKERISHFAELPKLTDFYFLDKLTIDGPLLTWKKSTLQESVNALKGVRDFLASQSESSFITPDKLEAALKSYVTQSGQSVGAVFWPLRVALTGRSASPGPQEIMWVLGKDGAIKRLDSALSAF